MIMLTMNEKLAQFLKVSIREIGTFDLTSKKVGLSIPFAIIPGHVLSCCWEGLAIITLTTNWYFKINYD